MKKHLRDHIIKRVGKTPENLDLVLGHFHPVKVRRNAFLLRQGEICKHVYYIVKGCIQVYVLDTKGNESTREIYVEDQWVTDIFGFQNQTPAKEFMKCIEATQLLSISYESFKVLSAAVPQFGLIYKQILEASYNNTVYRVNTLTSLSALERLQWFQEHKPRLMMRLSGKMIASYLGISPETMSRLRSKL